MRYDTTCKVKILYIECLECDDKDMCDKLKEEGYHQYEISNFAKPGYESKHNTIYWKAEEYLGLGLAAHSYFEDYRFGNTEDMNRYITRIMNENIITYLNGKKEKERKDLWILYIIMQRISRFRLLILKG